ncbi:MAG TPA: aminotransferase class V-fold PLP-dependent enzyme [Bryobacteraceae bacterium]|nr:aminotransferase class V-fold PLP-dependent enzyme [Bryobacteraceae bacterium]
MNPFRNITRRTLFRTTSLLAAGGFLPSQHRAAAPATKELQLGPTLYESIGVTPLVNCKGTFTIITGSQTLPEVKRAMDEASRHYVHMDELMNAVSPRLAELTKSEWGIVTAGCAAALTHATAACIAGADPEKMQRLPNLDGLKNEVIIPRHSRNVYDHAVRMLGVKIVEVDSTAELESAINPKTAMIMIMSSPHSAAGPLSTENIAKVARRKQVPIIVDAAAEFLTIPSIHLQQGADMVAYSGGKCLRGPQSAGLLLGQKDLLQAAWINSAPHHAFGRSLKVGKEEIMGMLAAVEMWVKRDHKAEWGQWESWLTYIDTSVTKVAGVSTQLLLPEDLSNRAPELLIKWDAASIGITGKEVEEILLKGRPRIVLAGSTGVRPDQMASSVTIMPYMMMPDDYKIAAQALYSVLSKPPKIDAPHRSTGEPASVAGEWTVHIEYTRGASTHKLTIAQSQNTLIGTHTGETLSGPLHGAIYGTEAHFTSSHKIEGTSINYTFRGTATTNKMSGTVSLGEYGQATWTATKKS